MQLITPTDYFFDHKYFDTHFTLRFPLAAKYKPGFQVIQEYKECGNSRDPLNTIPKELQILPNLTIVHMYTMSMETTLDWHTDGMKLDYMSQGKYTALLEGTGTLEVKSPIDDSIETYTFTEKYRYVRFYPTHLHRFVTNVKTTMLISNTLPSENCTFDVSMFAGLSGVAYEKLKDVGERKNLQEFLHNWYKEKN